VKPWLIDELDHAGREHLDPSFVVGYDRKQGHPDPSDDLAVFAAHGLAAESTIVDLGAGTGQFTLPAARRFGHVLAVDVSPVMVKLLRQRVAKARLRNVDCVRAGFLSYEHTGAPIDGIYTRNALHHLPDFWKGIALERMAKLLRPEGVLHLHDLIYDFDPSEAEVMFDRWFRGAHSDPASGYTASDLAEHVRNEFSTYRWLFEPILAAAGFDIVNVEFRGSVYGLYTCLKR